jgi:hypothetical protein
VWSLISAILHNFRRKNGVFLKKLCHDHFFAKSSSSCEEKTPFFRENILKIITSVPNHVRMVSAHKTRHRWQQRLSLRHKIPQRSVFKGLHWPTADVAYFPNAAFFLLLCVLFSRRKCDHKVVEVNCRLPIEI